MFIEKSGPVANDLTKEGRLFLENKHYNTIVRVNPNEEKKKGEKWLKPHWSHAGCSMMNFNFKKTHMAWRTLKIGTRVEWVCENSDNEAKAPSKLRFEEGDILRTIRGLWDSV